MVRSIALMSSTDHPNRSKVVNSYASAEALEFSRSISTENAARAALSSAAVGPSIMNMLILFRIAAIVACNPSLATEPKTTKRLAFEKKSNRYCSP